MINIGLYQNADGSLDGRYKLGDKPITGGGTPALAWSAPQGLADGNTLTITTDGTYNFGTKANAKPLLYWSADDGGGANLALGRTDWADSNGSTLSTTVVATNSTQSYMFDHSASEGKALGRVDISSDSIYVCRRMYEAFDITNAFTIRTRVDLTSGTLVVGSTITGQTSGATGVIRAVVDDVATGRTHAIFYERVGGTINDSPATDFINAENMTASNGAVMVNAEFDGTFRTMNYKTIRFWANGHNTYATSNHTDNTYDFNHDGSDSTFLPIAGNLVTQIPNQWLSQECVIKQSTDDVTSDGVMRFKQGNEETLENGFISKTALDPGGFDWIAQAQVSNGSDTGTKTYYDELYVDDSFSRVMIGNATTWAACTKFHPLPASAWATNSIDVTFLSGEFTTISGLHLYVFDSNDSVIGKVELL